MAVPVGERDETTLQVLVSAKDLARHTIQKCKAEKLFPKRNRWILTQPIVTECLAANSCIRRANATYVHPGNVEEYKYRHMQQVEAHAHLGALYELLDIAFCSLDELENDESFDFWAGLIHTTDAQLKAWMRSDTERFRKTLKQ